MSSEFSGQSGVGVAEVRAGGAGGAAGMPVDEAALSPSRPLTGLDRCDSCGAAAYVRVGVAGGELLFCGHHATEFEGKLKPTAEFWHDERSKIPA